MKGAVIVFPGSNCDRDLAVALRAVGGREPAMVWHGDADLPDGIDLIAVPGAGAYSRSMASNYNHVPRPPVVAVREGRISTLVRRETLDDLLALDVG